jgi:hypothetical protein
MILLPIAILRELGELVVEECSPWEIYKATVRLMIRPDAPMTATQANFFKDWAMAASHEVTGKSDSELHLKLDPVATSNKTFLEWSTSMVDSMLGPEQDQTPTQGTATPQSSPMSAELTEVMKAMTNMAEMSALLAQQSSRTGEKAKEAASEILKTKASTRNA